MIRFFEINDISRYLVILFLLIGLRLTFLFLYPDPFLIELHFKAVASQLNHLGESYVDVLHHQGPMSASVFRFFYGIVGYNLWYARLFALLLIIVQVFSVTIGLNNSNAFGKNNTFTAVIHIVLLHLFPDMLILSPMTLGMTFVSLAYVFVMSIIRGKTNNSSFLWVGLFLSLSGGFLFPLLFFAIPTLFIIVVYTKFDTRSIGLYLIGFSLPLGSIFAYYYFLNHAQEYLLINVYYGLSIRMISQLPIGLYILVALVPTILFIVSIFKILAIYNMVNYQQKMIVSGFFYLIFASLIFAFLPDKSIYYLMLFVPFLVHFIGIIFIETNYKYINRICLLTLLLMLFLPSISKVPLTKKYLNRSSLFPQRVIGEYGRVLNLSEDKNVLFNNEYATGFCEYMIAKEFFYDSSPSSSILLYDKLEEDMPDAIYDPNGIVEDKFKQMPGIKKRFTFDSYSKIYKLNQ